MGLLRRIACKEKKPAYEPRTFMPTPGKFGHRRSPSDVLVVSHPSPTDYQERFDYVEQTGHTEQATVWVEDDSAEEIYEEPLPLHQERRPTPPVHRQAPPQFQHPQSQLVNRQTAQQQWQRLRSQSVHRQGPQPLQQRSQSLPELRQAPQSKRDLTPSLRRQSPQTKYDLTPSLNRQSSSPKRDLTPSLHRQAPQQLRRHSDPASPQYHQQTTQCSTKVFIERERIMMEDGYYGIYKAVTIPGTWVD